MGWQKKIFAKCYALSLSGILHSSDWRPALGANVLAKPKKRTPPPPPAIEAPPAVEAGTTEADVDELFSRLNVEKATTTFSAYLKAPATPRSKTLITCWRAAFILIGFTRVVLICAPESSRLLRGWLKRMKC